MKTDLLSAYRHIFADKMNTPEWAVHKTTPGHTNELIHCAVPFVGKQYAQEEIKILLYASAENLSDYNSKKKNYLDCDSYAINRHRNSFDASISQPGVFFPNVHIQPINDGCLAIAALYVYMQFQQVDRIMPADFLERIAFANYCKYTIQPDLTAQKGQNQDYAGNRQYLEHSHDYIEQDIHLLRPDLIIMPKTIYWRDRKFIDWIKGDARIIPIYQMNARNINRLIKAYPKTEEQDLSGVLREWYEHLEIHGTPRPTKTKKNFLSVFRYMDAVLQQPVE